MAQKKAKSATSSKKQSGAKKSTKSRSRNKSGEAKKILGEALTGAAMGAIKGAADAVREKDIKREKGRK